MTLPEPVWDLSWVRGIEAPDDPYDLRVHLLDAHNQDPELVPSSMTLAGLQELHVKRHAAGADHGHEGITNGTGVQPFGDGVKSSAYADSWRCRRCGRSLGQDGLAAQMPIAAAEGRLSCGSCLDGALVR